MTSNDNGIAERIWFRCLRLHVRLGAAIARRLKTIGLSVPQCDVLTTLTEQEGVSQQDLAKRLYVTKGNISGLIDRLVASGLVERRSTEGDRRTHAIHLTDEGRRLAKEGLDMQRAYIARTFGRLSPGEAADLETLIVTVRDFARDLDSAKHSA